MELLKEINTAVNEFHLFVEQFFTDLKEAEEELKKVKRLGLGEEAGADYRDGNELEFDAPDTSKMGKPEQIKSGSGRESRPTRRPGVPIPGDLYFDPASKKLRVINNRNRDRISGRDFKTTEDQLQQAPKEVVQNLIQRIAGMDERMAEEVKGKMIWVPTADGATRQSANIQGQRRSSEPNVHDKVAPNAPDWQIQKKANPFM